MGKDDFGEYLKELEGRVWTGEINPKDHNHDGPDDELGEPDEPDPPVKRLSRVRFSASKAIGDFEKGIYLCRHAQTDANKLGNLRGWLDFPLNAQGKLDAVTVGDWLHSRNVEQIRCSDLRRARQTAKRIQKTLQMESVYETGFWYRDWTTGLLDGRPQEDVWGLITNYVTNEPDIDIPGGEPFNVFLNRCLPRVQMLMDLCVDPQQNGNVIALVTHSSVLRAAAGWIDAGMDKDFKAVNTDTFLDMQMLDSSVVWMCPSGKGWKWQLLDPLGADKSL